MLPADWERARVIERVRQALPWRVEAALAPFVAGLRRRLARDLDRLHAYHNDLHREASQRVTQLAAAMLATSGSSYASTQLPRSTGQNWVTWRINMRYA